MQVYHVEDPILAMQDKATSKGQNFSELSSVISPQLGTHERVVVKHTFIEVVESGETLVTRRPRASSEFVRPLWSRVTLEEDAPPSGSMSPEETDIQAIHSCVSDNAILEPQQISKKEKRRISAPDRVGQSNQTASSEHLPGDQESVDPCEGHTLTTVVVQNLSKVCSCSKLLSIVDEAGFAGAYDFVYLPINFQSRCCYGFAFLNFVDSTVAKRFQSTFDGLELPNGRICRALWSKPFQGLEANVARYRNSPVMHPEIPDEFKPVVFRDGQRAEFPQATKKIPLPRIRNFTPSFKFGASHDLCRVRRTRSGRNRRI